MLDVDAILTRQAVAMGGVDTGVNFWGNTEYTLNVETGKAGLWPGAFLRVVGSSGFGDNVLNSSAAIESQTVTKIEELPGTDLTIVVPESNPVHDTYDVSVAVLGRAN